MKKYTETGHEVEVTQALESGFIGHTVYDTGNEDDGACGPEQFFKTLYDKPPTQKMDSEILLLQGQIERLTNDRQAIQKHISELQKSRDQMLPEVVKYSGLELLKDFIDGKITHYVEFSGYSELKIIPFKDATSECGDKRKLKLLTLFGGSCGKLNWALGRYYDHSSMAIEVVPVTSLEMAHAVISQRILEKADETMGRPIDYIIKAAEKFGITLPKEYTNLFYQNVLKNQQDYLDGERAKLAGYEKIIENAKSKIQP